MHTLLQCGKLEPLERFTGQQRCGKACIQQRMCPIAMLCPVSVHAFSSHAICLALALRCRSCLSSLEGRRAASSIIKRDCTSGEDDGDDTMKGMARPRAAAEAAAVHPSAAVLASCVQLPPAPASGDAHTARADQCVSLGDTAAKQAVPQSLGDTLLWACLPSCSQATLQQGSPAAPGGSFCAASAAAELADAFCCGSNSANEELQAAAEAAYGDVAAGLCAAFVGPSPEAVLTAEHSNNATFEQLLEQLLAEVPRPGAQQRSSTAAAGTTSMSGDETWCTQLVQHSAWAHEDALAPPSAMVPGHPGVLAQHEARQGLPASLPAAAALEAEDQQADARLATDAARRDAPAAAALQTQLAAQVARMQRLQTCYADLEGMLALVKSVTASALPLLV